MSEDDWVANAEPEPTEPEAPEGGWPWQLQLCQVLDVQKVGYNTNYKVKCKKCGWSPKGMTQVARVEKHYASSRGKKPAGVTHCIMPDLLEEAHPAFMAKIKARVEQAEKRKSSPPQDSSRSTAKKRFKGMQGSTSEAGKLDWALKSPAEKQMKLAEAHKKVSLFFFVHNIPLHCIDVDEFHEMIDAVKEAPSYVPVCRQTLSTSHLADRDAEATAQNDLVLSQSSGFGLVLTGDGYRSKHKKRQYHNHHLLCVSGPIFLGMADTTGEPSRAVDICDEFSEVIGSLPEGVASCIMLGVLDTPSPNVAAWTLLMDKYPRQIWQGCMAHEVSLCMKDIAKLQVSVDQRIVSKSLVIWVNNHPGVFKVFAQKVEQHFSLLKQQAESAADKAKYSSKMCMTLYMPGDTRMLTIFKLFFRLLVLKEPLLAMFSDPEYKLAAQKAMKGYNARTGVPPEKKYRSRGQSFIDPCAETFGGENKPIWESLERWCQATLSIVYLHRMCDTHKPFMHFVYYGCCLVDKQFRLLAEMDDDGGFIKQVQTIFLKRWYRWHTCLHSLCYHANPAYQEHEMSNEEYADCMEVTTKLFGDDSTDILLGLKEFKRASSRHFWTEKEWAKIDDIPMHLWWDTFGAKMQCGQATANGFDTCLFTNAMKRLCSLCGSASSTEQGVAGWSKVGAIEGAKRSRLKVARTNKLVNIGGAAWARKQLTYNKRDDVVRGLADTLAEMVDEAQAHATTFGAAEAADDTRAGDSGALELGEAAAAAPGEDVESSDEIEEFEEFVGDFSGPRTQEIFTQRRSLRCNNKLEASLPRLVNFQGSDAVCRRIAFV